MAIPNLVDVNTVARALRCSYRQVQLFVLEGMPRAGHGKYDLAACVKWHASRRVRSGNMRRQHMAAENRALLRAVRRELRSVPCRVAPQLFGKPQTEIARILRAAINEAMTALPSGDVARKGEK